MRHVVRWWETLGRPERIVAMSLAAGSLVAMVNSTAWAIAVSYMARQKALVALASRAAAPGGAPPDAHGAVHDGQPVAGHEALDQGSPTAPARLATPRTRLQG